MAIRYGVFLAFIAACSGSGSTSSSPPPAPPPPPGGGPTVNASMTDINGVAPYAFSPASLTISVGTRVTWTNAGKAIHTSTSDETPPVWNSNFVYPAGSTSCDPNDPYCSPGSTPPGTYTRTFTAAGTYPYHCENHRLQGMTGTITVTP